jgi:outer membrane biosynthesis protein TonB
MVGLTAREANTNFASYDTYLLNAVGDAVERAANKADQAIFSQVPAGKVVIDFQLDQTGNVSSTQVLENNLNDALAQFFLHALQDGQPYKPWTAGEHTRELKLTFHYE